MNNAIFIGIILYGTAIMFLATILFGKLNRQIESLKQQLKNAREEQAQMRSMVAAIYRTAQTALNIAFDFAKDEEESEAQYILKSLSAELNMPLSFELKDVASMHPSSIVSENIFGDGYKFTANRQSYKDKYYKYVQGIFDENKDVDEDE